jgi:hypothetical protein
MQICIPTHNDLLEKADRVKISIQSIQQATMLSRIRYVILTPGEFSTLVQVFLLLRDQPDWLNYIRYNKILIAIASFTYVLTWYYSFPLLITFWDLFHQANWESFFRQLFTWSLFQAIFSMLVRYFFGIWAIDSFKILPEMNAEYQAIQQLCQEQRLTSVVRAQIRNDLLRVVPGIVQNSLSQAIAMSPLQGMDDMAFEKLQGQLSTFICNLLEEKVEAIDIEPIDED